MMIEKPSHSSSSSWDGFEPEFDSANSVQSYQIAFELKFVRLGPRASAPGTVGVAPTKKIIIISLWYNRNNEMIVRSVSMPFDRDWFNRIEGSPRSLPLGKPNGFVSLETLRIPSHAFNEQMFHFPLQYRSLLHPGHCNNGSEVGKFSIVWFQQFSDPLQESEEPEIVWESARPLSIAAVPATQALPSDTVPQPTEVR